MKRILVQLTDLQLNALKDMADESGNSRPAIIRTALTEYLVNHDNRQSEQVVELNSGNIRTLMNNSQPGQVIEVNKKGESK